jgi:nucleoside-diphosphate-sugar epimerase
VFGLKSEPPVTRFSVEQLATAHWFDTSAAERDLGYVPAVTIDEGLESLRKTGL